MMSYNIKLLQRAGFWFLLLICPWTGCESIPTQSVIESWERIGLENQFALRLVESESYLYVCAGRDGLWRTSLSSPGRTWELMGMVNDTLGAYTNVGVLDAVVNPANPAEIIVAYHDTKVRHPSVYKTQDSGQTWTAVTTGLSYTFGTETYFNRIRCLLSSQGILLGAGSGIFKSTDFGDSWQRLEGKDGTSFQPYSMKYIKPNDTYWIGGETGIFSEFLMNSTDQGTTWDYIDLKQVVPHDNAIYTVAAHPDEPQTIYLGMQGAIIKSIDNGRSWISPLVTHAQGAFFRAILIDPNDPAHVIASAGSDVRETFNKGDQWTTWDQPWQPGNDVMDMCWGTDNTTIFFGTLKGVYVIKLKQ